MTKIVSNSDSATTDIGRQIATHLIPGDVVLLYGDLGAGKTTLMKGIAAGLRIKQPITSPTFALMNVYPIKNLKLKKINLVHIDTYRLENEKQLYEIGAEDYIGAKNTICVIEWPEKIKKLLKNKKALKITIEHLDVVRRQITINRPMKIQNFKES